VKASVRLMNVPLHRLEEEFGSFEGIARNWQLEAIGKAVKDSGTFESAMWEALAESRQSDEYAEKLWNPKVSDAELGALVRKIQIDYAMRVSEYQEEDLRRYL